MMISRSSMIPRSSLVAALCLALAGMLHAAVAVLPNGAQTEEMAMEGGGSIGIAALGDSFADMAEGAEVPELETLSHDTPPDALQPELEEPVRQALAPSPRAPVVEVPPTETTKPEMETAEPVEQVPTPEPEPSEPIVAESEPPPPETSERPETRPEPPQPQVQAQKKPQPEPTPSQRGNAQQSATAGAATGDPAATQQANQGPGKSAEAANAAATNYPGQVMRHVQRTRRERVKARGSAQVSFTIAANGGLAAVSLASSSGSPQLDQAALQQIRRAAPFPPPPEGAQRNFTLRIDGK